MSGETRPVLYITYAFDDPDEASVLDVSGSLKEARMWMYGQIGFVYRCRRQADGSYSDLEFVEKLEPLAIGAMWEGE
jgi:hypothetical protein